MSARRKKILIYLSLGLWGGCLLTSLSFASSGRVPTAGETKEVRVAILKNVAQVTIKINSRYQVADPASGQVINEGRRLRRQAVVANEAGIQVGENSLPYNHIRFIPRKDVTIKVGDKERRYRGATDILRSKDGLLTVVNRLDVEDYVRGVLYHEVSHRWPIEAIKAQAVAARTYAFYRMEVSAGKDYDVTNDIYSQVYGGRISERYRTNMAVNRTRGEVMVFQGEILPAYYHATCGGHTEDAGELWNHSGLAPLKGVRCQYCFRSPHFKWKKNFRLKNIQDKLNKAGYDLGLIKAILVLDRDASGRIRDLQIITRDNKKNIISGKDFRNIVGPNELRSNDYRIVMKGYYVDIIGRGWGHGVGMCQWGAREMATRRFKHKSILRHYYPGVEIVDYKTFYRKPRGALTEKILKID